MGPMCRTVANEQEGENNLTMIFSYLPARGVEMGESLVANLLVCSCLYFVSVKMKITAQGELILFHHFHA